MAKRAEETAAVAGQPQGLDPTVEEHAAELQVPDWQVAGLKRLRRWGQGRRVSRAEFASALNGFLAGPMNQRRG